MTLDLLLSSAGQELLAELAGESLDDELRVITRYRARYEPDLVRAAVSMAKLRRRARAKFSRADAMYFTQAGLEQASTEAMARWSARRFAPYARVADLCSGIGGDLIALADAHQVVSVDLDPVHLRMGELNAGVYGNGERVSGVLSDVRAFDVASVDAAFIDPARRAEDRRFRSGESEPPLEWCVEVAERGTPLGIKAAPGLPTDVVPDAWELEFVSEGRELKASVLWSPALRTARRRATILPEGIGLTEHPGSRLEVREPGRFLLDPDPAVTRAGLVEELGVQLGDCWKIDEQVAFLSSEAPMRTPFGRLLVVEDSQSWSLARLKEALRGLDVGSVDIRKRGSAVDVDEIQRRLRLVGSRRATVVLTRVKDRPWMLVCTDPDLT